MTRWWPSLKPGWCGSDQSLRDFKVALVGLLQGPSVVAIFGTGFASFSIFGPFLGPNSGPVFGPKNGSSNLAFNRKCIVGVKFGPKNGSQKRTHFWDLEISFFLFFLSGWPLFSAGCELQSRLQLARVALGPGEKQALMISVDATRMLLKYGSNRNHHQHFMFCTGRGYSSMQGA